MIEVEEADDNDEYVNEDEKENNEMWTKVPGCQQWWLKRRHLVQIVREEQQQQQQWQVCFR